MVWFTVASLSATVCTCTRPSDRPFLLKREGCCTARSTTMHHVVYIDPTGMRLVQPTWPVYYGMSTPQHVFVRHHGGGHPAASLVRHPRAFDASITFVDRPPIPKKPPPPTPERMRPSHVRVAGGHKALGLAPDGREAANSRLFYGPDVANESTSLTGETRSAALSRDRLWPGSEFGAHRVPPPPPTPPPPNRCVSGEVLRAANTKGYNFAADQSWWGVRDVASR